MSKLLKIIIFVVSGLVGLLVFVTVALLFFVDANVYKPRLEATASQALEMEVKINGLLKISFFPDLLVILEEVCIRSGGADVASAKEARVEIDLLSLLHKEVRISRIALQHSIISIERNRDVTFNFDKPEVARNILRALDLATITISGGTFLYADEQSGQGFEAGDCNLDVRRLQLSSGSSPDLLKNLSCTAELDCGETMVKNFAVSDVKFSVTGKDGIFDFNPILMRIYGGQASGSIRADLTDAVPLYHVSSSLLQFHLDDFLKDLPPNRAVQGMMDFSADLTMQGKTANELRKTMTGQISLRGKDLTLNGSNLDQEFDRFESSQNFNLVDVGVVFFAGPFGLLVTKGFNFASVLRGSGGRSEIKTIVSDWKIERGVAQAQDVAMATNKNRIALQGALDFVNEHFLDVTVALIDAQGCAKVHQKIHGTFQKPVMETPNIFKSIAGPLFNLLKKGRDLFPGGECKIFYAGSVAAPK